MDAKLTAEDITEAGIDVLQACVLFDDPFESAHRVNGIHQDIEFLRERTDFVTRSNLDLVGQVNVTGTDTMDLIDDGVDRPGEGQDDPAGKNHQQQYGNQENGQDGHGGHFDDLGNLTGGGMVQFGELCREINRYLAGLMNMIHQLYKTTLQVFSIRSFFIQHLQLVLVKFCIAGIDVVKQQV